MSDYRRSGLDGGTYSITVTLQDRQRTLQVEQGEMLREAVRRAHAARPLHIEAWVVLPEHKHGVWTLPEGDSDFSARWKNIKIRFAKSTPGTELISVSRTRRRERGNGYGKLSITVRGKQLVMKSYTQKATCV